MPNFSVKHACFPHGINKRVSKGIEIELPVFYFTPMRSIYLHHALGIDHNIPLVDLPIIAGSLVAAMTPTAPTVRVERKSPAVKVFNIGYAP
jgi:hypothetical protein